jgi:hypothetical protein
MNLKQVNFLGIFCLYFVVFEEDDEFDFSKTEGLFVLQEFDEAIYFSDCIQSKIFLFFICLLF